MTETERQECIHEMMAEFKREVLPTIVREIRDAAMAEGCLCRLGQDQRSEMGHLFGVVKDLGDGDLYRGMERIRDNENFVSEMREGVRTAKTHALRIAVGALVVALLGGAWMIFKAHVHVGQP